MLRFFRANLENLSGKIWCGQILPLCSKKEQKIKNY